MFSLFDIDRRIAMFLAAAEDLDAQAAPLDPTSIKRAVLRGYAHGLRDAAGSLGRMIENEVEREAREAMRNAS